MKTILQILIMGTLLCYSFFLQGQQCLVGDCMNGYGKFRYPNGEKYVGEFKLGQRNGIGVLYYADGSKYSGEWLNDKPHGKGTKIFTDGKTLEGTWEQGVFIKHLPYGCIDGDCKNGLGAYRFSDGSKYNGEFKNGFPHGKGIVKYSDGNRYEGELVSGSLTGRGTLYFSNGEVINGYWENGQYLASKYQRGEKQRNDSPAIQLDFGEHLFVQTENNYRPGFVFQLIYEIKNLAQIPTLGVTRTFDFPDKNIKPFSEQIKVPQRINSLSSIKDTIQFVVNGNYERGEVPIRLSLVAGNFRLEKTWTMALEMEPEINYFWLPRNGKDYAVFFANSTYEDSVAYPSLRKITHQNAQDIAKELKERYGFDYKIYEDLTRSEIKAVLDNLADRYESGRLDDQEGQLFIYFTGHGDTSAGTGYFLPSDVKKEDLELNGLAYPIWRNKINQIKCKHILVAIDACYSGTFDPNEEFMGGGNRDFERPGGELTPAELLVENHKKYATRLFITSGGNEQTPLKSQFAKQLLEALRSQGGQDHNGLLSFKELETYLEVANPKPRSGSFGGDEGGSDFLFFGRKRK